MVKQKTKKKNVYLTEKDFEREFQRWVYHFQHWTSFAHAERWLIISIGLTITGILTDNKIFFALIFVSSIVLFFFMYEGRRYQKKVEYKK